MLTAPLLRLCARSDGHRVSRMAGTASLVLSRSWLNHCCVDAALARSMEMLVWLLKDDRTQALAMS